MSSFEVSSVSTTTSPTPSTSNVETVNKNEEECVLAQGRICICSSCEEEREKLASRKRKRNSQTSTTLTDASSPSSLNLTSSEFCQPVGKKQDCGAEKLEKMTSACKTILTCIGEDPTREGLHKTPERWAKALLFMTSGYSLSPENVINDAVFTEDSHKEIVVVKDIDIHSMCEHHMLPFTGRIHVGYIPNGKSEHLVL